MSQFLISLKKEVRIKESGNKHIGRAIRPRAREIKKASPTGEPATKPILNLFPAAPPVKRAGKRSMKWQLQRNSKR